MASERLGDRPADHADARRRRALAALCVTEVVSWGVLYYAFPVLVGPLSEQSGWSQAAATGAFSVGALASAGAGIVVGRVIDRRGPRAVMTTGSVLGALAVGAIAVAPDLPLFYAAWAVAGVAQAATFYPPAFAALTGWYGADPERRIRALTTVTLAGGFASTVFAPLTAALAEHLTWRGTYLVLAAVLAVVTVPLHGLLLTPPWPRQDRRPPAPSRTDGDHDDGDHDPADADARHARQVITSPRFVLLAAVVPLAGFGLYAATINLVPLLTGRGVSLGTAAVGLQNS